MSKSCEHVIDHMIRYLFILLDSDKTAADDLMAILDSKFCQCYSISSRGYCVVL